MTEYRPAKFSAQDVEQLEEVGYALFRAMETELALKVLALALRVRGETMFPPSWDQVPEPASFALIHGEAV